MAKSPKQDPKTVTKTVVLAKGVVDQLGALEAQQAALEQQKQALLTTALLQAGLTGQIDVVGFDAETRKVTVHVAA